MTEIDDGGPAFPAAEGRDWPGGAERSGMPQACTQKHTASPARRWRYNSHVLYGHQE